jgi:hypothetical protein
MPAFSPTTSSRLTAVSRCLGLALSALVAAALVAPIAGAADAKYEGISADGGVAIFSTVDRLVPGDTDNKRDVYERSIDAGVGDYVTRQVSVGPVGGNNAFDSFYYGVSQDGSKAFFSTIERLTPDDTDSVQDVYMRDLVARTTTRISRGDALCEPACGNGSDPASPVSGGGIAADGDTVFFSTAESLSPADTGASLDVYARDLAGDSTELVSRGDATCEPSGCGRAAIPAFFLGASDSGGKAFFSSAEGLVDTDTDGASDIYKRDLTTGTTALVSTLVDCPVGLNCNPVYRGTSNDGTHVFFETNDRIATRDSDSSQDVYDWSGGVATLVSTGPDGGNGAINALYAGNSPDGEVVLFETAEVLDAAVDTDAAQDVYARTGSTTELVSAGDASCSGRGCGNGAFAASLKWVSPQPSNSLVALSTLESLTSADRDGSEDIYLRDLATDTTTLASPADSSCITPGCGDGAFDANFAGASRDGSHVFFVTDEALVPADTDVRTDVYERFGGATTLVSAGDEAKYGNGPFDAQLHGISEDGSRAFIVSKERLEKTDDFLDESDVYMRSSSRTLLVSVGNDPTLILGPPPPRLQRTDPSLSGSSTQPAVIGQAAASALIKIYTNSDCTGNVAATGTAEELASPGISVVVAVGSMTSFWATAEAEGVTSPCSTTTVSYTQQSDLPPPPPPDPGGGGGGGTGTGSGGSGGSSTGGATAAGRTFLIPQTRITFAPSTKTRARRPTFRFTDETGQEGTTFRCKIDRRAWFGCNSPTKLKRLRWGKHTFQVTGVNAAGAQEPGVAKQAFKLVKG